MEQNIGEEIGKNNVWGYKMVKPDDNQELEGKLVESLEDKELGKLAEKYANINVYDIFDDKLLSDIPIINTVIALAKSGLNFRDRLYVKKIAYFLHTVGKTTPEQRKEFIKKYCQDIRRFEETVLLILEQADNMEKSALIGKIFRACILNTISFEDALVLSSIVNKALWQDLEAMFVGNDTDAIKVRLANNGLLNMSIKRVVTFEAENTDTSPCFRFTANSYAKKLIEIAKMV